MTSAARTKINIAAELNAAVRYHHAGRLAEAEQRYERVLACSPGHADALHLRGVASLQKGELDSAAAFIRKAVAIDPRQFTFYNSLGNVFQAKNQPQKAICAYRTALQLKPDYAEAHYNLGNILQADGNLKEAVASYRKALLHNPKMAEAYNNLGVVLNELENEPQAIECYLRAIEQRPDFIDGYNNLAAILEGRNRLVEARQAVDAALRLDPASVFANLNLAQLNYRSGDYNASLKLLEALAGEAPAELAAKAYTLLGLVYDKLGRHPEAFKAFEKGNTCEKKSDRYQRLEADRKEDILWLNRLRQELAPQQPVAAAIRNTNPDGEPAPIFLTGFPRSGTTLLQQILKSHSNVTALEEKPVLENALKNLLSRSQNGNAVLNPNAREAAEVCRRYWSLADAFLAPDQRHKVVLDKLPLNIIYLGIIPRIFPEAKIIVALRHPADAVLSNFMQRYKLNKRMANFLDLDHAAQFYVAVMSLFPIYRKTLGPNLIQIRYEDIVHKPETEARRLLTFLGLEWEENVLHFDKFARGQNINTPSYSQVTKPIYRDAVGRWKKYEKELSRALITLRPLIQAFGYSS